MLLTAPVPGLPEERRQRILERAEGVPFYAVETVRMLLDRGLLVREGNAYRVTEPIETLEVPETLQALIAARLDGLTADERRMLQDASVLGRTFTVPGLAAMTGLSESELKPLLTSLVRKEVLTISADPLSSERGQFGFIQDLVKKVAYETMSKKERKSRHLAAAAHLLAAADEDEIIEVVAAHYVDAFRAAPGDPDAQGIKERATGALVRAGERASSLAANAEAQRHFELAAEMMDDTAKRAELLERAGVMASGAGRQDEAGELFERSIELFEGERRSHPAARVSARLAQVVWDRGRLSEAVERMDRSFQILSREEPDSDLATLAAQLGRLLFFSGDVEVAADRIEVALEIAEAEGLPETLSQALITKSIILIARARRLEGLALLRYALDVALEHEIPSAALRLLQPGRRGDPGGCLSGGGRERDEGSRARSARREPLLGMADARPGVSVRRSGELGRGARHGRVAPCSGCRGVPAGGERVPRHRALHPHQPRRPRRCDGIQGHVPRGRRVRGPPGASRGLGRSGGARSS